MPSTSRSHSSTRQRWLALAAASTTVIAFSGSAGAALAAKDSDEWVTICHRTNSTKNPYVQITVKRSAVDGVNGKGEGQGDHYGQHAGPVWDPSMPNGGDWGDIIPPVPGAHSGVNWDARGQEIYDAGCFTGPLTTAQTIDTDNDGTPDATDPDDDGDGTPDLTDPSEDADGDGTPDATDPDDDNDGTPDVSDADDDGDAIPDVTDPDSDFDGDGIPNATDRDDDGDGTPDTREPDVDSDGIPNSSDSDDDGDGIPDVVDPDDDNNGEPEDTGNPDSDRDGTPDAIDRDDDNDGIPDAKDPDSNGDGLEESERQRVIDPAIPEKIKPGKEIVIGAPDEVTDMGMEVTYRASCTVTRVERITPRGDADAGQAPPRCVIGKEGNQATVRVIYPSPAWPRESATRCRACMSTPYSVKVQVVATAGAVANHKGYRQEYWVRVR